MPPMQVEDVWEQVLITLKYSFVIVDPTLELAPKTHISSRAIYNDMKHLSQTYVYHIQDV